MEVIEVYKDGHEAPEISTALGEREKFHPSTQQVYEKAGIHPAGYQVKVDHLHAFSTSTLGESGNEKFHGKRLAANINFVNRKDIICRNKDTAKKIADSIYFDANHHNFKNDKCLFIRTKAKWQPVIVGKQNTLDSVERAMRETYPKAEFKRDNYAVKLIDKPKNEKRRISKKECLNMIFDKNGLKPNYKGVVKKIIKSDDRYTNKFLEDLCKNQRAFKEFLEYKNNKGDERDEFDFDEKNGKRPQAPKPTNQ
jgi:hypothetical protein